MNNTFDELDLNINTGIVVFYLNFIVNFVTIYNKFNIIFIFNLFRNGLVLLISLYEM